MLRGARSIYVDYVDYDEVAHHAGGNRLEALEVLEALDQVLGVLERSRATRRAATTSSCSPTTASRRAPPFADRYGTGARRPVRASSPAQDVRRRWRRTSRAGAASSPSSTTSRATGVADRADGRTGGVPRAVARPRTDGRTSRRPSDLVVLGSGNLGLVYAPGSRAADRSRRSRSAGRGCSRAGRHPGYRASSPCMSREHGPVVIGADGYRRLRDGVVTGWTRWRRSRQHAAWALLRAVEMPSAPDIYVNSAVDASTLEVSAFEDLVGVARRARRLAGPRTCSSRRAHLVDGDVEIRGAEQLHDVLVSVLEGLGHRTGPPTRRRRDGAGVTTPSGHAPGTRSIRVTWHGHATLLVEDAARVLTDPVLTGSLAHLRRRAGLVPRPCRPSTPSRISHLHMRPPAPALARPARPGTPVLLPGGRPACCAGCPRGRWRSPSVTSCRSATPTCSSYPPCTTRPGGREADPGRGRGVRRAGAVRRTSRGTPRASTGWPGSAATAGRRAAAGVAAGGRGCAASTWTPSRRPAACRCSAPASPCRSTTARSGRAAWAGCGSGSSTSPAASSPSTRAGAAPSVDVRVLEVGTSTEVVLPSRERPPRGARPRAPSSSSTGVRLQPDDDAHQDQQHAGSSR